MTKNIIGLQIVGSLCYVSVGLVKSIVWMSPIRTMDAFNHGRSANQEQREFSAADRNNQLRR